MSSLSVAK